MAIEFQCSSCQTRIRTPDDSAGKMARCPKCSATLQIPAASQPPPPAPNPWGQPTPAQSAQPPGFAPFPPAPGQASKPAPGPPSGFPNAGFPGMPATPPGAGAPNPFGDRPANPLGVNPYQSPAHYAYGYGTHEGVRAKLLWPGIGMIAGGTIALLYIVLAVAILIFNPQALMIGKPPENEAEKIGFWFGALFVIVMGTIFYSLELLGGIAMVRGKGRPLAMAGAITGCIPCNICCVFGLPFSIWALVVLNQADVKATFR